MRENEGVVLSHLILFWCCIVLYDLTLQAQSFPPFPSTTILQRVVITITHAHTYIHARDCIGEKNSSI